MGLDPAVGAEIHGDAGGQQEQRDSQCPGDPGELDSALEDEEVEDAEDEDQHGCFGEEGRAAPGGDDGQIEQRGGTLRDWILFASWDEGQACGVWGGLAWDGWNIWS